MSCRNRKYCNTTKLRHYVTALAAMTLLLGAACKAQPTVAKSATTQNNDIIRWRAIAMLEGGSDDAVGAAGEVSRYQILPCYWPSDTPIEQATNPAAALRVARRIMARRVAVFTKRQHRVPSDYEWAQLWHGLHDADYAGRFVNLIGRFRNETH